MMEWGFDVTEDTLRLCYGSETWYDDTAAFSETIKREEGQYIAKGDVLWHIDGRQATRHRGTSKQHYTFEEPGPTTASEDEDAAVCETLRDDGAGEFAAVEGDDDEYFSPLLQS